MESVWNDIFCDPDGKAEYDDIQAYMIWLYHRLEYGSKVYPGFFIFHSIGFAEIEKADGKQRMQRAWTHIEDALCFYLRHDPHIRSDAFNGQFTVENFARMIFSMILSNMLLKDYDPAPLLEIIRRVAY